MALKKLTHHRREEVIEFKDLRILGEGGGTLEDNMDALRAVLEDLINDKPGAAAASLYDLIKPWYTEKQQGEIEEEMAIAFPAELEEGDDGLADDPLDG